MMIHGNPEAKILVLGDYLGPDAQAENLPLAGRDLAMLESAMLRAGFGPDSYCTASLFPVMPFGHKPSNLEMAELGNHKSELVSFLRGTDFNIVVALGPMCLKVLTTFSSMEKYKVSILKSRAEFGGVKVLPLPHPRDIMKNYQDTAYLSFGCQRLKDEVSSPRITTPERIFHLSPTLEDTFKFLDRCLAAREISIDLETGRGQINTVGFSLSPTEAIAIGVLPSRLGPESHYKLWRKIADVCESSVPKIAQNALYEIQWLSKYGIRLNNVLHDTMWCMKFLHPELKAGLANVGRFYTPFTYWKDDNESWNNVRDWGQHFDYNCKDTTGTHWAYLEQRKALRERGLEALYYGFVQKFLGPITEMTSRGFRVDEKKRNLLIENNEREVNHALTLMNKEFQKCPALVGNMGIGPVNPRSSKQLHAALEHMGMVLPTKTDKKSGKRGKTTDKVGLHKLKKKYPKQDVIKHLIQLSKKQKMASSYLNFDCHPDGKVRYALNAGATETGRWNSTKDAFGMGFNAQTVPKSVRSMFVSSPGRILVQIDLKQAESRYVAWDAPEYTLMELIEDGKDIHRYVAASIFGKREDDITHSERQLGKKSGHAANYGVGPRTFAEQCLLDGIDITEGESKKIIEGYHSVFPGIRKRQARITNQLKATRRLVTPLGRERFFYGRMNDSTFREAFAFEPQSVIPDITNHLMLYLWQWPEYWMLVQVHDSLLLDIREEDVRTLITRAQDLEAWHPKIELAGGELIIPIDIEVGYNWKDLDTV